MIANITAKLNTLNKLLEASAKYTEEVIIMKDGTVVINHTVNIYADITRYGYHAPVLITDNNQQTVVDTVDNLITKIKENNAHE
jgi:hypothetical protein